MSPPQADEISLRSALMTTTSLERYAAGRAFSNWDAPSMYQAEAADLAWSRTIGFFDAHLR